MARAKLWAFTDFNVLTEEDDHPTYGEYGQCQLERTTTHQKLHWQGFAHFTNALRKPSEYCKTGPGVTWTRCRGSLQDNLDYTSKDETSVRGPFTWGTPPPGERGHRTDLDDIAAFALECRDLRAVALKYPSAYIRNYKGLKEILERTAPKYDFPLDKLREWQREAMDAISSDDSDRHIHFFYDDKGGSGKTSLTKYIASTHGAWVSDGGKLADMGHAYNGEPYAIFDIPRSFTGTGIPDDVYHFCEKLKDGVYMKTKYESRTFFFKPPKVIIFANCVPNHSKWTHDRLVEYTLHDGKLRKERQAQPFQAGSQAFQG